MPRFQLNPMSISFIAVLLAAHVATAEDSQPDTPFVQEYRDDFVQQNASAQRNAATASANNDVRQVNVGRDGRVWVTTRNGVFLVETGQHVPFGTAINGPAYVTAFDSHGDTWIGAWDGLYKVDGTAVYKEANLEGPVVNVLFSSGRFLTTTPRGVFEKKGKKWSLIEGPWGTTIRDLEVIDNVLYIASWTGLYSVTTDDDSGTVIEDLNSYDHLLSRNLQDMAVDSSGQLWVASRAGLDVFKDGKRVQSLTPADGLPSTDVRSVTVAPDGTIWAGTGIGVARFDGEHWSFLHSLRWLPNDEVRGVSFAQDGTAWVGTRNGLVAIKKRTMTLEAKADYFQKMIRDRHVRPPGLTERCRLPVPGSLEKTVPMDTDNDGLFTGLYLAAESYRYAATGAEDAKANAIEAYRAMELLQTVTGTSGFVARTVIPVDWTHMADGNRTYTPQEQADRLARESRWKKVETRWHKSADGKWMWKGDTSSDEMTGHFFAYPIYYDLVADKKEKKRVAKLIGRIMDHIIDSDYGFKDIDGKATRWGVWGPDRLNDNPDWWLEKGCNSVEILAYLTATWHCTQDDKYQKEIQKLLTKHNYAENIMTPMHPGSDYFTYIGHQLLALSYPALMRYETNPERQTLYRKSLEAWFPAIRRDASPLYAFVYAKNSDGDAHIAECMDMFRTVSLDMIQWTVNNSHREDVKLAHRPAESRQQTTRLLPANERSVFRWDRNVYEANRGDGGRVEGSSVYWLLPYWMGRYEGIIAAP